jgi:transcription elongation GreA/GreB family factor
LSTPAANSQRLDDPLVAAPEPVTVQLTEVSGLGSTVEVEDLTTGLSFTYRLVEPHDAAPKEGRLSIASPVGMVLRSRRPGEVVTASTPSGHRRLRIVAIT